MPTIKHILTCISIWASLYCFSQQPVYKQLTTEEGLPSDEIYSIIEDQKGMIWIGCDAGLYKYDGIRFIHYNCTSQRSKSITGLTLSPNGELYCFSFNGQLFYLNNDTLKELKHQYSRISSISIDKTLNLYISHTTGIAFYNIPKKHGSTLIIIKTKRLDFLPA